MSTLIRASCDDCGDVELSTRDLQVRICDEDDSGTYVFRCPSCAGRVVKPAERRVVDLLAASGVLVSRWSLPAELFEHRRGGRPFTHDDLIDFHQILSGHGWLDDLLAAGR